jgi:MFS family permease
LWFFSLAVNISIGLFFSIIPVHIKDTLGIEYVWIIASVYYIFIMLSSFFVWKSVDKYDNRYVLIFIYLFWLLSMWFLYLYKLNYIFLLLWIFLLAIVMSYMNVIIVSLVNKIWKKNNTKDLFSFFFVFGNMWLVLGILLSTFIKDNLVYLISFILIFTSMLSYSTLFKKSLLEIKKNIQS